LFFQFFYFLTDNKRPFSSEVSIDGKSAIKTSAVLGAQVRWNGTDYNITNLTGIPEAMLFFKPQEVVQAIQLIKIITSKPAKLFFGLKPQDQAWDALLRQKNFKKLGTTSLEITNGTGHIKLLTMWLKRLAARTTFTIWTPRGNRPFVILLMEGKCVVHLLINT
jgi:hypothetical protein